MTKQCRCQALDTKTRIGNKTEWREWKKSCFHIAPTASSHTRQFSQYVGLLHLSNGIQFHTPINARVFILWVKILNFSIQEQMLPQVSEM